ncbi:MAG: phosphatidate cytidylyltransferase [Chloroflexota bacterium]|jgi:phosphatidate cytidylyltransferase
MLKRTITALALLLVGMPTVILGGPFFFVLIAIFVVGAAWEYWNMFKAVGYDSNLYGTVGGVLLILAARAFFPELAAPALAAGILLSMAIHLLAFERGRDQAALDFGVALGGLLYVGWLGAYLLDIRNLPDGGWYFMIVLPSVWLADSGAYSIGAAYGRHKMSPRLSPKKSWEGYAAGVFSGAIGGAFFVYAYQTFGALPDGMTLWQGALLGLVLGLLSPLGDLGESMFKRQAHMKDSSNVFPGHGGFFDRIDSWIWAAAIGYYFILWFVL